jgi:hypothetical protein
MAVSAYGRAVAGGDVRCHALDPSAIGLDDLWRFPGTGRPTAFALAWHRARIAPDTTVLLCLRNLDAAPFHLWLSALHAALQSPARPRNLLVLGTVIGNSTDEEEYPNSEALRHHLVALKPRIHPRAGNAAILLDEPLPPPSLLEPSDAARQELSSSTFLAIAKRGKDPSVVRRAVRLCRTLGDATPASGATVAQAWIDFLREGRPDGLPTPLSAGHDALKTLHVQR